MNKSAPIYVDKNTLQVIPTLKERILNWFRPTISVKPRWLDNRPVSHDTLLVYAMFEVLEDFIERKAITAEFDRAVVEVYGKDIPVFDEVLFLSSWFTAIYIPLNTVGKPQISIAEFTQEFSPSEYNYFFPIELGDMLHRLVNVREALGY